MKEIGKRLWDEPAVVIGLLVSIALLVITLLNGDGWDVTTVLYVIAPFASALGVRPLVKPMHAIEEENKAKATASLVR